MKRDAFQIAKELVCVIVFIAPGSNIHVAGPWCFQFHKKKYLDNYTINILKEIQ